jgi:NTP pyrophosphatase (non-canonical NTP hydrolase)
MNNFPTLTDEQKEALRLFLINPERKDRNIMKCTEELIELSEVLIKTLNKNEQNRPPVSKIIEEIGDVIFRTAVIAEQYNIQEEVFDRIDEKAAQLYKYYLVDKEQVTNGENKVQEVIA